MTTYTETELIIKIPVGCPAAFHNQLMHAVAGVMRWYGNSKNLRNDDGESLHVMGDLLESLTPDEFQLSAKE